ncbi:MAG: catalase family protein [Myxococcales bacterium]|nr:catalase family protein [Myxococcales bacterium]
MTPSRTALLLIASLTYTACDSPSSADDDAPHDGIDDPGVAQGGKADTNGYEDRGYESTCILRVANGSDLATLDDDAGLWGASAEAIIAAKRGPDGEPSTADDVQFATLTELDAVDWVGFLSFRAMLEYGQAEGLCPGLGEEYPPPGEDEATDRIIARIGDRMQREFTAGARPSTRGLHAKGRCVQGTFTVDNAALPASLRVGVFASNSTYPAWVRFSNGNPHVQADGEGDVRGMAIKLMDVPGTKLLEDEKDADTHDFLLNHTPTIPTADALDFAAIVDRSEDDENPVLAFLSWNPFDIELTKIRLLIASVTTPIINPLSTTYWSQSPYRLGGETVAVKYRARPCPGAALGPELDDADPEYFTASMQQQLAAGTACFEFAIQRQRDPATMPIEDNSVEWREAESAFVPVATLEIAAQDFASDANREACEHLSFTPWHALPEHRPLGSLNRARRRAYEAISKRRHELNGVPRQEP